jgi:hypothetical protein
MVLILLDHFPELSNGFSESASLGEDDADEIQS